jgi:apolipoprotein N-acyltransferase
LAKKTADTPSRATRRRDRTVETATAAPVATAVTDSGPLAAGAGRGGFVIRTHARLLLFAFGTFLLKSLIFEPIALWPVSFVCLVPWLVMVASGERARPVYWYSVLMGFVYFLINARWLYHATGLGYVALAFYLAAYFPLMACPIRGLVRRRGVPLAFVVPIVWVGCEMLRAVVMTGFPWFFLAHANYRVLVLTQISDLVGAYGLSFVVAAVNGAVADLVLWRLSRRTQPDSPGPRRRFVLSAAAAGVMLAATVGYGAFRLNQTSLRDGPKVAMLQSDFINSVDLTVEGANVPNRDKLLTFVSMLQAASAERPDLYLLPESPWYMELNPEARATHPISVESYLVLTEIARETGGHIVTGFAAVEHLPGDPIAETRQYNSAAVIYPDDREIGRYDKIHLVPFGEAVPFRMGRWRFLYFWFNRIMPFSEGGKVEFSLFPGDGFHAFEMAAPSRGGEVFRFGIPICYEDVMPYVSRRFVSGGALEKQVDFLLNISNDGWFGRGIQQPQHLAICTFRAVENRVGIARAVNTGGSAMIDPTGRITAVVEPDPQGRWPGKANYAVATLKVDSRYTLYSRHGDWFAWACVAMMGLTYVDYVALRTRAARAV